MRSHGGWAACGGGATRDWEAAGRGRNCTSQIPRIENLPRRRQNLRSLLLKYGFKGNNPLFELEIPSKRYPRRVPTNNVSWHYPKMEAEQKWRTQLKGRSHPPKSTPHNSRPGYSPELLKNALDSSRENLRLRSKYLLWIKTRKNHGHLKSVFWLQN